MESINPQAALFIGESVVRYKSRLIEFHPKRKLGTSGFKYTGCASKDILQIATGHNFDIWFEIFVHETSHLDQQKERPKWFSHRAEKVNKFDEFLEGRGDVDWADVFKIIELEHDCEERSIDKIDNYDLPINPDQYAQKANMYLFSYVRAFKTHKWTNGKKGEWKTMPKDLRPLTYYLDLL